MEGNGKMNFDLIMPTVGRPHILDSLRSLHHIPFPYRFFLIMEGSSWPEAINIGFKQTTNDIILMDDDVIILEDTFKDFEQYYEDADVFGFRMMMPMGGNELGVIPLGIDDVPKTCTPACPRWPHISHGLGVAALDKPVYCGYVSTSFCVIKRHVVEKVQIREGWPGHLFEDNDFMFRVVEAGFRILYVPNQIIHLGSMTKRHMPDFTMKQHFNFVKLKEYHPDWMKYSFIVPLHDEEEPEKEVKEECTTPSENSSQVLSLPEGMKLVGNILPKSDRGI